MAKSLMVVGTSAKAGKSFFISAVCRILAEDGHKVAPFKIQSITDNITNTQDGFEIDADVALMATASFKPRDMRMNPVILCPCGEDKFDVTVMGKLLGEMTFATYAARFNQILPEVEAAYKSLAAENDIIIIEADGNPAEPSSGISCMEFAELVGAPVIIISDYSAGGAFPVAYGAFAFLDDELKEYVKGIIINKIKGDADTHENNFMKLRDLTGLSLISPLGYMGEKAYEEEASIDEHLMSHEDSLNGGEFKGDIEDMFPSFNGEDIIKNDDETLIMTSENIPEIREDELKIMERETEETTMATLEERDDSTLPLVSSAMLDKLENEITIMKASLASDMANYDSGLAELEEEYPSDNILATDNFDETVVDELAVDDSAKLSEDFSNFENSFSKVENSDDEKNDDIVDSPMELETTEIDDLKFMEFADDNQFLENIAPDDENYKSDTIVGNDSFTITEKSVKDIDTDEPWISKTTENEGSIIPEDGNFDGNIAFDNNFDKTRLDTLNESANINEEKKFPDFRDTDPEAEPVSGKNLVMNEDVSFTEHDDGIFANKKTNAFFDDVLSPFADDDSEESSKTLAFEEKDEPLTNINGRGADADIDESVEDDVDIEPQRVNVSIIKLPNDVYKVNLDILKIKDIDVTYVYDITSYNKPDFIVIPYTKKPMSDLLWLRSNGLEEAIRRSVASGAILLGVCGGYHMLSETISDPNHVDMGGEIKGFGFFKAKTILENSMKLAKVRGIFKSFEGIFSPLNGKNFEGHAVLSARTSRSTHKNIAVIIDKSSGLAVQDGLCHKNVFGLNVFGILENSELLDLITDMLFKFKLNQQSLKMSKENKTDGKIMAFASDDEVKLSIDPIDIEKIEKKFKTRADTPPEDALRRAAEENYIFGLPKYFANYAKNSSINAEDELERAVADDEEVTVSALAHEDIEIKTEKNILSEMPDNIITSDPIDLKSNEIDGRENAPISENDINAVIKHVGKFIDMKKIYEIISRGV